MSLPKPCNRCGRLAFLEDVVTIPAAEYRELLARPPATGILPKPDLSRIGRDPEVGDFIVECSSTVPPMAFDVIHAACIDRFGRERAPSKSAIHRFVKAVARGRRPGTLYRG